MPLQTPDADGLPCREFGNDRRPAGERHRDIPSASMTAVRPRFSSTTRIANVMESCVDRGQDVIEGVIRNVPYPLKVR
jgi:hypothetical protein